MMGAGYGALIAAGLRSFGGVALEFVRKNWRGVAIGLAVVAAAIWIASLYAKIGSGVEDLRKANETIQRLEGEAAQFRAAIERGEKDREILSSALEEAKAATARAGTDVAKAFAICAKEVERLRLISKAVSKCPAETSCPDGGVPEGGISDPLVDAANTLFEWGK